MKSDELVDRTVGEAVTSHFAEFMESLGYTYISLSDHSYSALCTHILGCLGPTASVRTTTTWQSPPSGGGVACTVAVDNDGIMTLLVGCKSRYWDLADPSSLFEVEEVLRHPRNFHLATRLDRR